MILKRENLVHLRPSSPGAKADKMQMPVEKFNKVFGEKHEKILNEIKPDSPP